MGFASTGDLADKEVSFSEIGPGIYAFTAQGDPNTGVVVGDESCLVMDAQATPAMAASVIARVRAVTDKPISHVVLSHYHAVRVLGAAAAQQAATARATAERAATERTAARQAGPSPAHATPTPSAATPSGTAGTWIDDVLDDSNPRRGETPGAADAEVAVSSVETTAAVEADASVEVHAAEAPGAFGDDVLDADVLAVAELDAATPEPPAIAASDDTVWTFDHAAADAPEPALVSGLAYVRAAQTLWPGGAAPAAHLTASLASRLGGSVAVVRHGGGAYVVEMLAGPAALSGRAATLMAAAGHPLHRIPQDGVLSLLGDADARALTYHEDPGAAVGQAVARTLAGPPQARVLLVADLPPDAPALDRDTAALVGHYADVLAGLTTAPPADEPEEPDVLGPDDADALRADADGSAEPDGDAGADAGEDGGEEAGGDAPQDEDAEPNAEAVAQPGQPRGAPPLPPRGVILNAEIDAARRDRRLLVFALVTVADVETVVRGGADGVVRAEAALRQRLTAAPAVRRVEPFGELVFGVFLDAEGPEVVAWAERVSASGVPLLVGAVPASGSGEIVRATAMAALQSAYEKETVCVLAA